jgi:anthranilate synthase component 2
MKIAVIDNFDSFVYNLVRYLQEEEKVDVTVMRNDQIDHVALAAADAILLSPGPGLPSEAGNLLSVIDKYHLTKKLLGVCLGHQAIGEYFGVKLVPSTEIVHGKSSIISLFDTKDIFKSMPEAITVGRYHSWMLQNIDIPIHLKITATTSQNEIMAIRHSELPIFGVQFHPESILTPQGRNIIKNWLNV